MSKGKEQGEDKKPVKRSWWARIGLFFSGLFQSKAEKEAEDLRTQGNLAGSDRLALIDLPKSLKDPSYREDIANRLASGRADVTSELYAFLSNLEESFDDKKISLEETDELLTYIHMLIQTVERMDKNRSEWNLGDKDVPRSWEWWKQKMYEKIQGIETKISRRNPDFQRKLITVLSDKEEQFNKKQLVDFISQGLKNYKFEKQIQSELAKGPSYITLTIPAYLSDINKELKKPDIDPKRRDEIIGILVALKQFIENVNEIPKGTDWIAGDNKVTGSWEEWYTAVTNSIQHLEGNKKLGVPTMDNQPAPKETVSSVDLPEAANRLSQEFSATTFDEEPKSKSSRGPLPNPKDLTPSAKKRPLPNPADFSQSDQEKSKESQNPKPTEIVSDITHPQSESENLAVANAAKSVSVSEASSSLTPPRVSTRGPLPQVPPTSNNEVLGRKSARPQRPAPQPVRKKAVPKALRESQKGNLPDKQEQARGQENNPVAETPLLDAPPRPLPRKSESPGVAQPTGQPRASARPGAAQSVAKPSPLPRKSESPGVAQPTGQPRASARPGAAQSVAKPSPLPRASARPGAAQSVAKPSPLPRTSQKSGQVGSLLKGHAENNPPIPNPRSKTLKDESPGGSSTPKK